MLVRGQWEGISGRVSGWGLVRVNGRRVTGCHLEGQWVGVSEGSVRWG